MSARDVALGHRAARLLRWYPVEWRTRYGEEFTALLIADMAERPRSCRRQIDVALSGIVARGAAAGLGGRPLADDPARRSLLAVGGALAVFLVFALAIWSQLTIGWQWSAPDTPTTTWAMVIMTAGILALGCLSVAAAFPIAWALVRRCTRREVAGLIRPLLLLVCGIAVVIVGTHHFENGWPGTGGHPWAHQGIVPGGVAAFAWAVTLFVTSYWVHPGALVAFPTSEVAWMAVSPAAVASVIVGAVKLTRRLDLSPRFVRIQCGLAQGAALVMALFLTGAALWVVDGGPGPRNLFHIGAIDAVELGVMALALVVAGQGARRARHAAPRLSPS